MSDYPAHAFLHEYGVSQGNCLIYKNRGRFAAANIDEVILEFQSLLRQYQKVREAVVVLPDDAQAEIGDKVHYDYPVSSWGSDGESILYSTKSTEGLYTEHLKGMRNVVVNKILERNGKPVIFESELK